VLIQVCVEAVHQKMGIFQQGQARRGMPENKSADLNQIVVNDGANYCDM
jgi:hypothetical protein